MKTKHGFILFSMAAPAGNVCWIKGSEITGVQPQGDKYALIHSHDGNCEAVLHNPDEILDAIKQSYDEMRKK